ncbi:hypothetical protein AaE_011351 [Aphanomyces astaci]|uniref:CYRIA/CYRIB Rac1 binding domain-containing protein n=1 Tax=Aphanomyces astaci TaxID=112090 RepID=A0A6A4ZSC9_APHAT|nr:hypothetical protein AaE_011351 [Aphanomyces astaci]
MTTGPGVPETDMSKVDDAVRELYVNATRLVEENKHTLSKIEDYKGCQEHIRKSMSSPTNESYRRDSLSHLIPNVELIQEFYNAAHSQGVVFHELVSMLAGRGSQAHPALYKRLADVLVFCLTFDTLKVGTTLHRSFFHHHVVVSFQATIPSIQNDLSHYRRYIAANKDNQSDLVPETTANSLSLFVADHMPMLKAIIHTLHDDNNPHTRRSVAQLANLTCTYVVSHRGGLDAATELYCLRAMTAAILVYDHTSEKGAFRTKSTVKIKQCVQALQAAKKGNAAVAPLQDCLQYLSRHFNDPQTPHRIRSMFE